MAATIPIKNKHRQLRLPDQRRRSQTNQYKAAGVVKALNPKGPAIEIDHGDVEGLMPAMQMEFPVTDSNLLNGLAVNDKIDFTIENATDGMKVVAIKKK